jgi:hypothetical protein
MPTVTKELTPAGTEIYYIHLANGEYISSVDAHSLAVAAGARRGQNTEIKAYETPGFKSQVIICYEAGLKTMYKAVSGPSVWIGPIQPYTGPATAFDGFIDMIRQDEPLPEGGGGVNIGGN